MKNLVTLIIFLLSIYSASAQELNAQVIVNSDLVNQTNQQIFKTLERSLNEFLNTQVWTNQDLLPQEKITCSFVFNLTNYSNDQFEATLQVQSQRPVFDSNYDTPVLNFFDRDIVFSYQEFQPLFLMSRVLNLIWFLFLVFMPMSLSVWMQTLLLKMGEVYTTNRHFRSSI